MTRILSLDIATGTGWAFFDTDRHPASTECGAFNMGLPKTIKGAERRRMMRPMIDAEVCKLIDRFRPDMACIEAPLQFIKTGGGKKPPKTPLFKGDPLPAVAGEDEGGTGPNSDTVLLLNQLFAVAHTVCAHKCDRVVEVPPQTWQVLTKRYPGDTKERSIAFCMAMKIILPPGLNKKEKGDAADAAVIAQWAAGHSQELKLMRRAA